MPENTTDAPVTCCTPVAAEAATAGRATAAQCCGTAEQATDADACCAPAAKQEAQAAGATCC